MRVASARGVVAVHSTTLRSSAESIERASQTRHSRTRPRRIRYRYCQKTKTPFSLATAVGLLSARVRPESLRFDASLTGFPTLIAVNRLLTISVLARIPSLAASSKILAERGNMRGLGSGSFDPKTLAILEAAFDEAWLTLKCNGIEEVRANELARCILHLATEGERDPVRLHNHALAALAPAMMWREPQPSELN